MLAAEEQISQSSCPSGAKTWKGKLSQCMYHVINGQKVGKDHACYRKSGKGEEQ